MSSTSQATLVATRAKLRTLLSLHPDWSHSRLALETARSLNWVRDWRKRLREADPADQTVLWGKSHAPHTPPPPPDPRLMDRLLELRTNPPENLKRIPGPKTLLYFLKQDPYLKEQGIKIPTSTSTIHKYLVKLGCIERPGLRQPKPIERPEPLESIAIDFKDITTVQVGPDGKKQHLIEVLNFIVRRVSGRLECK